MTDRDPLLRLLTKRELELAAEYEALGDEPERRDAIRKELYNLRWKLDDANGRMFNAKGKGRRICRLECLSDIDIGKVKRLSDNGIGVGRMMDEVDRVAESLPENRRKRYEALRKRLERGKAKHTIATLRLIMENGGEREKSIQTLALAKGTNFAAAKAKYWADLHTIERFAGVNA
ncbi:MAG: hypothetical protein II946_01545 [Kiritimatiellae bacterium]|nr:hypothetical protein [Kiritimatiellia bacterium]